jgi:hypothetical protein
MHWQTCKEEHIVQHNNPSKQRVSSLVQRSKDTMRTASALHVMRWSAPSVITLSYDAARQTLEALSHVEGFDVHNHECYRSFLQEIVGDTDLAKAFNKARKQRNHIEYDAAEVSVEEAKRFRKDMMHFQKAVLTYVNKALQRM